MHAPKKSGAAQLLLVCLSAAHCTHCYLLMQTQEFSFSFVARDTFFFFRSNRGSRTQSDAAAETFPVFGREWVSPTGLQRSYCYSTGAQGQSASSTTHCSFQIGLWLHEKGYFQILLLLVLFFVNRQSKVEGTACASVSNGCSGTGSG